ncbi:MAG: hypothetical protein IKD43_03855 [Clostridia bacterium]|nr:hypothetical protein [Clostridia bacterium]
MQYEKVCVEIEAKFLKEGGVRPAAILWENGAKYPVERVKFIERAPARVSAILPVRFTCIIGGKEKFLWFEPELMRWFVEVKRE